MNIKERKLSIAVCDYQKNVLCQIYDNNVDIDGQATDVYLTFEQNGWKEVSFSLPCVCKDAEGKDVLNYRVSFIKADYLLRVIREDDDIGITDESYWETTNEEEKRDDGLIVDWYLISSQKIQHDAKKKSIGVTAGHISQLLKNKNLNLQLSDENKNDVGTAGELLRTVIDGTGWSVGKVYDFGEKDGSLKSRTLQESTKTGTFKMIEDLCQLYDAKAIYHGDSRMIDIIPLNSFSKPEEGQLPDVSLADTVLEMNYGNNVSEITRSYSTENMFTKMYAYGAYGTKTDGYCAIDECKHKEYTFTLTDDLIKGTTYYFSVLDLSGQKTLQRYFTASKDFATGSQFIYSLLDPASQMYIYNTSQKYAYFVTAGSYPSGSMPLPYSITQDSVQNYFSFLMDFSYYRKVGLFNEEMLQAVAKYQREMPSYYQSSRDASSEMSDKLSELTQVIGQLDYCKLAISDQSSDSLGYAKFTIDRTQGDNGVLYRTDYDAAKDNYFTWRAADELDDNGDAINTAASVVYIVRNDTDWPEGVRWFKAYLRALDDADDPSEITLWLSSSDYTYQSGDRFYLFSYNGTNGYLGSYQAADEAAVEALNDELQIVTEEHPLYCTNGDTSFTQTFQSYAWLWDYKNEGLYFYYSDKDSSDKKWYKVYIQQDDAPTGVTSTSYWFDWKNSKVYRGTSSGWTLFSTYKEKQIAAYFGTAYMGARRRDRYYKGLRQYYTYTQTDTSGLPAGNYYFESPYKQYWVFTTSEALAVTTFTDSSGTTYTANDQIVYVTKNAYFQQHRHPYLPGDDCTDVQSFFENHVEQTYLSATTYPFDSVYYHPSNIMEDHNTYTDGYVDIDSGQFVDTSSAVSMKNISTGATISSSVVTCRNEGSIYVVPNTTYSLAATDASTSVKKANSIVGINVYFYDENGTYLKSGAYISKNSGSFTTTDGTKYIKICIMGISTNDMTNISVVSSADNKDDVIVIDDKTYTKLSCTTQIDDENNPVINIPLCIKKLADGSDDVYVSQYNKLQTAQNTVKETENMITSSIGDLYRQTYWQDTNYVDGDQDKLYFDAWQKMEKMAQPEATYDVSYIDLYDANKFMNDYSVAKQTSDLNWPDVSIYTAVHLIDTQIDIDAWAYISNLAKCYDKPWQTQITIDTNLTNIYKHTFTSVVGNILNSVSQTTQKNSIYDAIVKTIATNNDLVELKALVSNTTSSSSAVALSSSTSTNSLISSSSSVSSSSGYSSIYNYISQNSAISNEKLVACVEMLTSYSNLSSSTTELTNALNNFKNTLVTNSELSSQSLRQAITLTGLTTGDDFSSENQALAKAKLGVSDLSFVTLWTNDSPASSMSATTITWSDSTAYPMYAVKYSWSTSYTTDVYYFKIFLPDHIYRMPISASGSNRTGGRDVTFSSSGGSAVFTNGGYNGSESGSYAIPLVIYGIKGVNIE